MVAGAVIVVGPCTYASVNTLLILRVRYFVLIHEEPIDICIVMRLLISASHTITVILVPHAEHTARNVGHAIRDGGRWRVYPDGNAVPIPMNIHRVA